jgi:hypothetical protein
VPAAAEEVDPRAEPMFLDLKVPTAPVVACGSRERTGAWSLLSGYAFSSSHPCSTFGGEVHPRTSSSDALQLRLSSGHWAERLLLHWFAVSERHDLRALRKTEAEADLLLVADKLAGNRAERAR